MPFNTSDRKFELAGRKSDIIKVGGRRVSAREIEEALHRTGLFSDAAVAPFYSRRTCSEKIGAIVVLREGGDADRRAIRKKCRELLPPFKVPDKIVFVEKIARTLTGKVRHSDIHRLMGCLNSSKPTRSTPSVSFWRLEKCWGEKFPLTIVF